VTESTASAYRPARRAFLAGCAGLAAVLIRRDDAVKPPIRRSADFATLELQRAAQRAGMCSSANAAGVGLQGEYFAAEGCQGKPILVRLDGGIDFDRSLDWPQEHANQRPHSVRWTGWVKPPVTGRYRFHVNASDARVQVSRQALGGSNQPADIELAAGRFYPITVELGRIAPAPASERIRLEWTAPHGVRFLVPRALLYVPTETVSSARA